MRTFTSDDFIGVQVRMIYIIYKQGMPNFDILVSLDYSFNEF